MVITVGNRIPEAKLMTIGEDGPKEVSLTGLVEGQKVVIFAVPGAYTPTCSNAHVPSFKQNRDKLAAKGISRIICVSVNDPFVMKSWSEHLAAEENGITMLGDPDGKFIEAIGMSFSAPPAGLYNRSKRFTMYLEDGEVKQLNVESEPGICELSAAETLLEQI